MKIAINASPVINPEAIKSPLFLPSSDALLLAIWFSIPPIKIGRVNSIGRYIPIATAKIGTLKSAFL